MLLLAEGVDPALLLDGDAKTGLNALRQLSNFTLVPQRHAYLIGNVEKFISNRRQSLQSEHTSLQRHPTVKADFIKLPTSGVSFLTSSHRTYSRFSLTDSQALTILQAA